MIVMETVWVVCRPENEPLYLTRDDRWQQIGLETMRFPSRDAAVVEAAGWTWATEVQEVEYLVGVIP